jgi:phenylpyruvate tautomerase PptA (4-oxalocrotonate tautomerase family)
MVSSCPSSYSRQGKGLTRDQKRRIVQEYTGTMVTVAGARKELVTIMIAEKELGDIGKGGVLRCDEYLHSSFPYRAAGSVTFNIRQTRHHVPEDMMKGPVVPPRSYRSRMTTLFWILALILAACLILPPVSAHPPSDMTLAYNERSKELQVTITHRVPNPQDHFIKEVAVKINGKIVNDSIYTGQPAEGSFTYTYPVETDPGDEIAVTASCVLTGSLTRQLYNTGTLATTPLLSDAGPPATNAAPAGIPALLGAAVLVLYRKK